MYFHEKKSVREIVRLTSLSRNTVRKWLKAAVLEPDALRNGAPFAEMPEPLQQLRRALLPDPGGDRVMAAVLGIVPTVGLDAVLVALALALESITSLDAQHREERLRLAFVDAPQIAKPFGDEAQSALAAMVHGREVTANLLGADASLH
jgi:endonuclease YncB( thermonuclease family)